MADRVTSFLDRLELLLKQATPGPWRVEEDGNDGPGWIWPHGAFSDDCADNELIVALVNAAPALVAALGAAQQVRQGVCSCVWREEGDVRTDVLLRKCSQCETHEALSAALAVLSGADTNEEAKT